MSARDFINAYETALGTQNWASVAPLISEQAIVIFSNGALHAGKDAVRTAYERNFQAIQNETYQISNVRWLSETADSASYVFEFHWSGFIEGQPASGSGRGTTVLAREGNHWRLVGEHLGPKT
ncbi:hypothetical protein ATO10_00920 [Actibacterium atlanticum]|uniref:DUF4440 domain-containing protein n=1 Tax=Actibacterium atlanticum TaxID=1461693 RepID=A0A058ZNW2_9RHOB|nr:nuclear transport factor 2 family protein [Actibacterium atlanticum]KCV83279.1 hypothetical protein ATO10_00920 [Actibacterium atlanticum]